MKKQKKTEELQIRLLQKQAKGKEKTGEMLAFLLIYLGLYLLLYGFCRQSWDLLPAILAGALWLVFGILFEKSEKQMLRYLLIGSMAFAAAVFAGSFILQKGWVFAGGLLSGNGLLETVGKNLHRFEKSYAVSVSESLYSLCTLCFWLDFGLLLAGALKLLQSVKSRIGVLFLGVVPVVMALLWQKEQILIPAVLLYTGILCFWNFSKKESDKAQAQVTTVMSILFVLLSILAFEIGKDGTFSDALAKNVNEKVCETIQTLRYGKKNTDSLPQGDFRKVGNLKLTDELALRITMEEPASMYLRGFVGSIYEENQFCSLESEMVYEKKNLFYWLHQDGFSALTQLNQLYALEHPEQADTTKMTIQTVGAYKRYVYTPYELASMPEELEKVRSFGDDCLIPTGFLKEGISEFQVHDSLVKNYPQMASDYYQKQQETAFQTYKKCETSYNAYVYEQYLQVPNTLKQTISKLLTSENEPQKYLADAHISYEEANTKITGYLNEKITYTEEIEEDAEAGGDFISNFLVTQKKGYDVHYAAAATLMYRSLGIPARYVEGYLITPEMAEVAKESGKIYVTGKEAHAWVEIYQDGVGWIPMEVTPPYLDKMERPDFETVTYFGGTQKEDSKKDREEAIQDEEETKQEQQKGKKKLPLLKIIRIVILIIVLLILLTAIFYLLWCKKVWDARRQKCYAADAAAAVQSTYAEILRWLSYDGIARRGGSRYGIREALKEKYGAEYAVQYCLMTALAEEAAYSRHCIEEKNAEEMRSFLEKTKIQILSDKKIQKKCRLYGKDFLSMPRMKK